MIKSQDELNTCNDGHRSSDVLLKAVEKCERLQKQLDMAIECLECIKFEYGGEYSLAGILVRKTLKQIKELEK